MRDPWPVRLPNGKVHAVRFLGQERTICGRDTAGMSRVDVPATFDQIPVSDSCSHCAVMLEARRARWGHYR